MQVYRELPVMTNQERGRPAELVGITSVVDDWTMARHRSAADDVLERTEGPFVLDAGTGMYLNAILLDIEIAPKVSPGIRKEAEIMSRGSINPRRSTREKELEIAGTPERGSIWSGNLRYDATLIYLRPDRDSLDSSITTRSKNIVRDGRKEAEDLMDLAASGLVPNPSVSSSIGVRELMEVLSGTSSMEDAEARISARTRKLARRQMRWFDKLAHTLKDQARITVAQNTKEIPPLNSMFDILGP
jgi:tRNA dimethylallyltransferase